MLLKALRSLCKLIANMTTPRYTGRWYPVASTITVSEEVSKKESLLSLAGAWSDMSDSEEEELVRKIRQA